MNMNLYWLFIWEKTVNNFAHFSLYFDTGVCTRNAL